MIRRSGSTVLLTLFALLLGTESLMLRAADKKAVEPGVVDKDAPADFTTTKSGLKYRVRRKGEGKPPTARDAPSGMSCTASSAEATTLSIRQFRMSGPRTAPAPLARSAASKKSSR